MKTLLFASLVLISVTARAETVNCGGGATITWSDGQCPIGCGAFGEDGRCAPLSGGYPQPGDDIMFVKRLGDEIFVPHALVEKKVDHADVYYEIPDKANYTFPSCTFE
ncbi:MAG: hypothetical protein ACXVB9_06720 [Bdellovibrionota bacterium]